MEETLNPIQPGGKKLRFSAANVRTSGQWSWLSRWGLPSCLALRGHKGLGLRGLV